MFEVEIKFRIEAPQEFRRQLIAVGIEMLPEVEESDRFYRHPTRDFARTDEALRLRCRYREGEIEEYSLTYKGPKIDSKTKTRHEIEIPVPDADSCNDLLCALGFEKTASVLKYRCQGRMTFQGRSFNIQLDRLPDLDDATFIELETFAEAGDLDSARDVLLELAESLGLTNAIRTSYLGLVSGRGYDS